MDDVLAAATSAAATAGAGAGAAAETVTAWPLGPAGPTEDRALPLRRRGLTIAMQSCGLLVK